MSKGPEKALFGLLTEVDSIEELELSGFDPKLIPSSELRPIYEWAIHQYRISGNLKAPTPLMFLETECPGCGGRSMAEVLLEAGILIDVVPEESVQWVIEELRARNLTSRTKDFVVGLSKEITSVPADKRVEVFSSHVAEAVQIYLEQQTKRNVFELASDGGDILTAYDARAADLSKFRGLQLGLDDVDTHMNGLHEGELMVLSAPPKGSKSYMLARIALKEFERGRKVALFTLENSIEMTRDRIACLATGVNPQKFEGGECDLDQIEAIQKWVTRLSDSTENQKLFIISPPEGSRTVQAMVSEALIRGVDSLLIDQLTFVDPIDARAARPLQIREIMHATKTLISTGPRKIPCVVAHQLTRDGIKTARKVGHLEMDDLAEGSEAERTADWVFSMWQSEDARQVGQFLFQILAARRRGTRAWTVNWDVDTGQMSVYAEAYSL
jgi:replicative DNA helicase